MRTMIIGFLLGSIFLGGTAMAQGNFSVTPNEFCPDQTTSLITFEILQPGEVSLVVEHVFTSVPVRTLAHGVFAAGMHQIVWNGLDAQGETVDTGVYVYKLSGDDWEVEQWGAVDCGWDANIQSRLVVDGHDVTIGFANVIEDVGATELGLFEADGTTLVVDFTHLAYSRHSFFSWNCEDSFGQVLPAGDFIYRMTNAAYSEDIPFSIDPFVRGELTVTLTDALGNNITGIFGEGDNPVVQGPLQQMVINFGRTMSPGEIQFILGGGLTYTGAFEWLEPISPSVLADSTGIIYDDFELKRTWPDIWGMGAVVGVGMFDPYASRFQLGFAHQGITSMDRFCQSTGETDSDDWVINPGPFYFSPTGTMDPPCNNPIPLGEWAEFRYFIDDDGPVVMTLSDHDGNLVRLLVSEHQIHGHHSVIWDRRDDSGAEVSEGLYHFIWAAQNGDGSPVVTSGDVMVSNAVSAVPGALGESVLPTLAANHPNPFNPSTQIRFDLPNDAFVLLTVLSLDGKRVTTLMAEQLSSGQHSVIWHGRDDLGRQVPSGAYFYQLKAEDTVETRRMMLLK